MARNARRSLGPIAGCLLVAAAGCGKKGPPRPPDPRTPRAPEVVEARQIGPEVRVWFGMPQPRGERPSQALERAELVRVDYAPGFTPPPDPDAFRRRGESVGGLAAGSLPAPGERIDVGDTALDALPDRGIGSTLRYAVQLFDARGRPGPLAGAVDLQPVEPLPPPERLTGEATGDGIRLVWTAPPVAPPVSPPEAPPDQQGNGATPRAAAAGEAADEGPDAAVPAAAEAPRFKYNVYRGPPDAPAPETPLHAVPTTDTEYLDSDVQQGERYRYVVRLLLADGPPPRESASSTPVEVLARDLIPPLPPTGLVAVQEGPSVRLFWNPNDERDVAGYRVYRRVRGREWETIGPPLVEQMTYNDRDVDVGTSVAYRVTALDRANPPNESAPSELAELDLVDEPTAPGVDR